MEKILEIRNRSNSTSINIKPDMKLIILSNITTKKNINL